LKLEEGKLSEVRKKGKAPNVNGEQKKALGGKSVSKIW